MSQKTVQVSVGARELLKSHKSRTFHDLKHLLSKAVRESQGRSRASYAETERPEWWDLTVKVDLGPGEGGTELPKFKAAGWSKAKMQAALALYWTFQEDGVPGHIKQAEAATKAEAEANEEKCPVPNLKKKRKRGRKKLVKLEEVAERDEESENEREAGIGDHDNEIHKALQENASRKVCKLETETFESNESIELPEQEALERIRYNI